MENNELLQAMKTMIEDSEMGTFDRITFLRDELVRAIDDTETKLLAAFNLWQVSNDARMNQTEANLLPLIARQTALENRQSELERRFNEFAHPPRQ
jgi:hypothetical protein